MPECPSKKKDCPGQEATSKANKVCYPNHFNLSAIQCGFRIWEYENSGDSDTMKVPSSLTGCLFQNFIRATFTVKKQKSHWHVGLPVNGIFMSFAHSSWALLRDWQHQVISDICYLKKELKRKKRSKPADIRQIDDGDNLENNKEYSHSRLCLMIPRARMGSCIHCQMRKDRFRKEKKPFLTSTKRCKGVTRSIFEKTRRVECIQVIPAWVTSRKKRGGKKVNKNIPEDRDM